MGVFSGVDCWLTLEMVGALLTDVTVNKNVFEVDFKPSLTFTVMLAVPY